MENITLTVPEVVQSTNASWRIGRVTLDIDGPRITVLFRGANGERREWTVEGDTALQQIRAINKSNNTTTTLNMRIMNAAIQAGVFAGTITGTPD